MFDNDTILLEQLYSTIKENKNTYKTDKNGYVNVSFKVKGDAVYSILKLLKHCEIVGGEGHSFSIEIDKEGDDHRTVGFDGDGADRLKDIKAGDIEVPNSILN